MSTKESTLLKLKIDKRIYKSANPGKVDYRRFRAGEIFIKIGEDNGIKIGEEYGRAQRQWLVLLHLASGKFYHTSVKNFTKFKELK